MGIRFQTDPASEPSEVMLHVRMWDKDALLEQEALGSGQAFNGGFA